MIAARAYFCPMHPDVKAVDGGKCPHCHMDLIPVGTKFGLLRHLFSNPLHVAIMIALMLVLMAAIMVR